MRKFLAIASALALVAGAAEAQVVTGGSPPPAAQSNTTVTYVTNVAGKNGNGNSTPMAVDVNGAVQTYAAGNTPILVTSLTNSSQTVVASAAVLENYFCYNPNSSEAYVQIYDISGAVTVGTSTPKWSIGIPATSGANISQLGLTFANAIKVAATTTATGGSAPSSSLNCNFGYH